MTMRLISVLLILATMSNVSSGNAASAQQCEPAPPPSFRVELPVVTNLVGSGLEPGPWVAELPPVWEHHPDAHDDFIDVPNGRPIYALIVSGYESNKFLDELMVYNFARHLMARGAYVHFAWWNNLLKPYMEAPLHHVQSGPGDLRVGGPDGFL